MHLTLTIRYEKSHFSLAMLEGKLLLMSFLLKTFALQLRGSLIVLQLLLEFAIDSIFFRPEPSFFLLDLTLTLFVLLHHPLLL